jgi:hypothetical protein
MASPVQSSNMPSNASNLIPAHLNSTMHHQQVQQKSQNCPPVSRNVEQPFASALRILAKQQDGKEDENSIKNESKHSNIHNEKEDLSRHMNSSRGVSFAESRSDIRKNSSPQPPDKKVNSLYILKSHILLMKFLFKRFNVFHLFHHRNNLLMLYNLSY